MMKVFEYVHDYNRERRREEAEISEKVKDGPQKKDTEKMGEIGGQGHKQRQLA